MLELLCLRRTSRDAINSVPLFGNKSTGFKRMLSQVMHPLLLAQGEYIVRKVSHPTGSHMCAIPKQV